MRENAKIKTARRLRKRMTDGEQRLWYLLRSRRFAHVKFRRQHTIGAFVCDFVCLQQKLIIEVDGGQHAMAADYDAKRSAYFAKEGFTVLRFWNNEVLTNTKVVLMSIAQHISPHPDFLKFAGEANFGNPPSPVNGRGEPECAEMHAN